MQYTHSETIRAGDAENKFECSGKDAELFRQDIYHFQHRFVCIGRNNFPKGKVAAIFV